MVLVLHVAGLLRRGARASAAAMLGVLCYAGVAAMARMARRVDVLSSAAARCGELAGGRARETSWAVGEL